MAILTTPITVKNVTIHNRLVLPPMATSKAKDGYVTNDLVRHYAKITSGGHIGLTIIEHSYISQDGKSDIGQLSVSRDSDIPGLKRLSDTIRANGSKSIVQINHAGMTADPRVTRSPILCVSTDSVGAYAQEFCQVDEDEISRLVQCYVKAACRVREAGFDGVELHSAHGFLLNQFYSPLTNHRSDEYGGDLAGRIKIHLKIIDEVRKQTGDDFIIAVRLGASDYRAGGATLADSIVASASFEKAGADIIDVSGGFCGYINPLSRKPGYFAELSGAIRRYTSVPVILTGGITTGADAERLLEEDQADFIGVGRAIWRDPLWAQKALT